MTAAEVLRDTGCTVVDEWVDDWSCNSAAVGHVDGRWAFVDVVDEGTCPGCASEDVGEIQWCSEAEARRLLAKTRAA